LQSGEPSRVATVTPANVRAMRRGGQSSPVNVDDRAGMTVYRSDLPPATP
jgi:hypothetical protein